MDRERIILILEYMTKYTNEIKSVTLKEIQRYLAEQYHLQDVSCLTIRRDLDRLTAAGYQITCTTGAHNTHYFSMKSRTFTFNEIRFLTDSVSINKFLTPEQKQHLFQKFESFCSESEVRRLISRIRIGDLVPPSLNLLENLERIHTLIAEKRCIDFAYGKFDASKRVHYANKKRNMIPCQVLYFQERIYLKCRCTEDYTIRTYRVDRMQDIHGGAACPDCPPIPKPEGVILDIFEPDSYELVTIRVKGFLLDDLLRQFGEYASAREDPENRELMQIRVRMGISKQFPQWALRYGQNLEVLSPRYLRQRVQEELQNTMALYQGDATAPAELHPQSEEANTT